MSEWPREQKNPLDGAVELLSLGRAQTLSKANADANKLSQGVSSSSLAVRGPDDQDDPIVRKLLQVKANLKEQAKLLTTAVSLGRIGTVRTLLEAKVEVHGGLCPAAIQRSDLSMLKVLMEAKAPIHASAIEEVARVGNIDIINFLGKKDSNYLRDPAVLYFAASNGHVPAVRAILDAKADVNAKLQGQLPLSLACFNGHYEVVEILRAAGAKIPQEDWDFAIKTHIAKQIVSESNLPLLLQLFAVYPGGRPTKDECYAALCEAICSKEPPAVIDALLAAKVSPWYVPKKVDPSPLELAKSQDAHEDVIQLLQRSLNRKKRAAVIMGLLWEPGAAEAKKSVQHHRPLVVGPKRNLDLINPVRNLDFPGVKKALDSGVDINSIPGLLEQVVGRSEKEALPIVQALLAAKASVDGEGSADLLREAIEGGRRQILKALLKERANPNQQKKATSPITMLGCAASCGDEASVKLLLEAKANIKIEDISYACRDANANKLVPFLCRQLKIQQPQVSGAQLLQLVLSKNLSDTSILNELIKTIDADIEARDENEDTLLVAAAKTNPKAIPVLLEAKANVAALSKTGDNALHILVSKPEKLDIYESLITARADVNVFGADNGTGRCYTPLQLAVKNYRPELVELFIRGFSPTEVNDLQTAIRLARQWESHQHIIDMLGNKVYELCTGFLKIATEAHPSAPDIPTVAPAVTAVVASSASRSDEKSVRGRQAHSYPSSIWAKIGRGDPLGQKVLSKVFDFGDMGLPKPPR